MHRRDIDRQAGVRLAGVTTETLPLAGRLGFGDDERVDSVTVAIDSPPRVARQQGYETAVLESPPIELPIPEDR